MALVLLADNWAHARGLSVIALTVDHGLRDGSREEAEQVKAWLSARGIEHHILTWTPPPDLSTAIQARARDARYQLMSGWCKSHGVAHLLVAHHLDDQAETVLMRMKKRSTLFGLSAMAAVRECLGIDLCRPLLSVAKARLVATLYVFDQPWVEDPSNHNQNFERVRVRTQLVDLASYGVTSERLAGAARGARAVCDIIDVAADRLIETSVTVASNGWVTLAPAFSQAPNLVRGRALAKLLGQVGNAPYPPSPDKLHRLLGWMESCETGARTLSGGLVRAKDKGAWFQISPELPRKKCKMPPNEAIR
jgi:tRNA(Ile)-lysidine synthase